MFHQRRIVLVPTTVHGCIIFGTLSAITAFSEASAIFRGRCRSPRLLSQHHPPRLRSHVGERTFAPRIATPAARIPTYLYARGHSAARTHSLPQPTYTPTHTQTDHTDTVLIHFGFASGNALSALQLLLPMLLTTKVLKMVLKVFAQPTNRRITRWQTCEAIGRRPGRVLVATSSLDLI